MSKKRLNKSLSRLSSVQILYKLHLNNTSLNKGIISKAVADIKRHYSDLKEDKINAKFLYGLVKSTITHLSEIDKLIEANLTKHESVKKLNSLLKAILRCGACETIYFNTPRKVVISEYVMITKDFFSEKEINFVNAILDKINRDIKRNE